MYHGRIRSVGLVVDSLPCLWKDFRLSLSGAEGCCKCNSGAGRAQCENRQETLIKRYMFVGRGTCHTVWAGTSIQQMSG